ncbi:MAG: hypothetical protein QOJ73_5622 [Streptosporangiaceae bacterium]|nr:hypothetical protein [Streptosporangiaceae bacterium]
MSSVTQSGTESSVRRSSTAVRRIGALILAIIGLLLIVVGILYVTTKAGSLPSFIPGRIAGSSGHHPLRAAGVLVLGLALLAAAGWAALGGKSRRP